MTSNDNPHASVLMFNASGQVLARKDSGKYGIPCTAVKAEEDVRGAAMRVASVTCLVTPSKMHPFFGYKVKEQHHTVFLVSHLSPGGKNPCEVEGNEWVNPWDLCTEATSTNHEFYRGLFKQVFQRVMPAVL